MTWTSYCELCRLYGLELRTSADGKVTFMRADGTSVIHHASRTHFGWFTVKPQPSGGVVLRDGTGRAAWKFSGTGDVPERRFGVSAVGHVWVCDALFNVDRLIGVNAHTRAALDLPLFSAVLAALS